MQMIRQEISVANAKQKKKNAFPVQFKAASFIR